MEEQGQPAKPNGSTFFDEWGGPPVASAVGVLVGFVVGRYVLGLQPARAEYLLIGGVAGGLLGTFWVMKSRYAATEIAQYRNSWCATWGRVAQAVFWGSLWASWSYTMYSTFWGYGDSPRFLGILWSGSGTVYFATLKRNWEFALACAGGVCALSLSPVARELGLLPQLHTLVAVLSVLCMLGGLGLLFWARRRTNRKRSCAIEVEYEGGQAQDP